MWYSKLWIVEYNSMIDIWTLKQSSTWKKTGHYPVFPGWGPQETPEHVGGLIPTAFLCHPLFWQRLFRWDFDSSSSSSSLWASPSGIFSRRPAAVPSALPMTIKGSSITLLPMAVLQALLLISLVVVDWRICEVRSEFEVLRKKHGNISESPVILHCFQIIWFSAAFFVSPLWFCMILFKSEIFKITATICHIYLLL